MKVQHYGCMLYCWSRHPFAVPAEPLSLLKTSPAPLLFSFSSVSMCILHVFTLLRMHTVDKHLLKKLQIFVVFQTSASGHFCLNLQLYCLQELYWAYVAYHNTLFHSSTEIRVRTVDHSQWPHNIYNKQCGNQQINWVGLQHMHPNKKQLSTVGSWKNGI